MRRSVHRRGVPLIRLLRRASNFKSLFTYSLVDLIEEQDIDAKVTMRGHTLSMELHGVPK